MVTRLPVASRAERRVATQAWREVPYRIAASDPAAWVLLGCGVVLLLLGLFAVDFARDAERVLALQDQPAQCSGGP